MLSASYLCGPYVAAAFYSRGANVSEGNKVHLHLHAIHTSQVLNMTKKAEEEHIVIYQELGEDDNFALPEAIQKFSVLLQGESGLGTYQVSGSSAENV